MALLPFRFVHASNLQLDEPLAGLGTGVTGDARRLAEDATLIAWGRMVDLCVDSQAELLLLVGNSFDASSGSLRARVALERGFEKLAAHEIDVVVVPGITDPLEHWKRGPALPPNVTLLANEEARPVVIKRGDAVIASVRVIASASSDEANWSPQGPTTFDSVAAPFHIGLVPAGTPIRWEQGQPEPVTRPDVSRAAVTLVRSAMGRVNYLALGAGKRGTHPYSGGIAHDPGLVQSLTPRLTGPCGVSVVDVSADGEIRTAPSTVAPVRWEALGVDLHPEDSWDDLVERMGLTLLEREPDSDDEMWIVLWNVRGSGKLYESLSDFKLQRDLWDLVEAEVADHHRTSRVHQLRREPLWDQLFATTEQTLGHTFMELMEVEAPRLLPEVQQELLELDWADPGHRRVLAKILEATPSKTVLAQARAAGMAWLS